MDGEFVHVPVLVSEVVDWLEPGLKFSPVLIDCTLGGGGHSLAFLERISGLTVIGIDRDSEAIEAAKKRLSRFNKSVRFHKSNFRDVQAVLQEEGIEKVGAVLYDLGVSSPQLDRAYRGFRYRDDAPLDMRMDLQEPTTAENIVNRYTEQQLRSIIARYGEERFAKRIAHAIVERRKRAPFETGTDLAEVVRAAIPAATRRTGPHPARRTFQALRIEVNDELRSLEESLQECIGPVVAGGRVGVISYHSLEDRIVKLTFNDFARGCRCPSDLPVCVCGRKAEGRVLTKKPVRPTAQEVAANPRSDSARLRVLERVEAA